MLRCNIKKGKCGFPIYFKVVYIDFKAERMVCERGQSKITPKNVTLFIFDKKDFIRDKF